MKPRYRYQFPIVFALFRWGLTLMWISPIVKTIPPRSIDAEDSMLIYIGLFEDDP